MFAECRDGAPSSTPLMGQPVHVAFIQRRGQVSGAWEGSRWGRLGFRTRGQGHGLASRVHPTIMAPGAARASIM